MDRAEGGGKSPGVSTVFLRSIVDAAVSQKVDRAGLLSAAELSNTLLEDREARVPLEVERRLWHEAARLTGDPHFGLHIAERVPAGAFDVLDYAARASATLGEAYERVARYQLWSSQKHVDPEHEERERGGGNQRGAHGDDVGAIRPRDIDRTRRDD